MSNIYLNTVIYKIVCKDTSILDLYVGHTTNFFIRKKRHFSSFKDNKNKLKVYMVIREHGGWDNWEMLEIEKYPCFNSVEARKRERHWFDMLKPSLNMNSPICNNKKEWVESCNRWNKKDPERYKEIQKQWREQHHEYHKLYNRKYHVFRAESRRFLNILLQ